MTASGSGSIHDGGKLKCGGKKKQGEGTCTQPAGWGTPHAGVGRCKLHGGCAPSSVIAGIEQQAQRLLYKYDAPAVTDHLEALQRLAGRALALEEAIGEMVNNLRSVRYESEGGGEQLRGEVAVLERAMDRCGKLLVDIAKLNIEERLARVSEHQAAMVAEALGLTFREMGLPLDQQRDAQARLGRHLRSVG